MAHWILRLTDLKWALNLLDQPQLQSWEGEGKPGAYLSYGFTAQSHRWPVKAYLCGRLLIVLPIHKTITLSLRLSPQGTPGRIRASSVAKDVLVGIP